MSNKSLQKCTETIAVMKGAIGCVRSSFAEKKNDGKMGRFRRSLLKLHKQEMLLGQKRSRYLTKVFQQRCKAAPKAAEEYDRAEFYYILNTDDMQFQDRFTQPDLQVLEKLEASLITGGVDCTVDQAEP